MVIPSLKKSNPQVITIMHIFVFVILVKMVSCLKDFEVAHFYRHYQSAG